MINSKWRRVPMTHRVIEDLRHPLVSAGEVVDNGNLVLMSPSASFIAPLDYEFGWHLNQMTWRLAQRFGTQDSVPMYRDASNVYLFDTWVEQPSGLHSPAAHGGAAGLLSIVDITTDNANEESRN